MAGIIPFLFVCLSLEEPGRNPVSPADSSIHGGQRQEAGQEGKHDRLLQNSLRGVAFAVSIGFGLFGQGGHATGTISFHICNSLFVFLNIV